MGICQKAEKVGYNVGIEGFRYGIQIGVKSSDSLGRSILPRTEFQQPRQLPKVITPNPLIDHIKAFK
jgi:hypothetical protein